jgi:hypothetical protein
MRPDAASYSLAVRSQDADASSLPSSKKATEFTVCEWPSSICSNAFQFCSPFVKLRTHLGI